MQPREATLALKPRADITRSSKDRAISGPTKRTSVLQKIAGVISKHGTPQARSCNVEKGPMSSKIFFEKY